MNKIKEPDICGVHISVRHIISYCKGTQDIGEALGIFHRLSEALSSDDRHQMSEIIKFAKFTKIYIRKFDCK